MIVTASRVDDSGTLSLILLSASMLSLVISFMGIKLKWFRHRLTLEQPEIATDTPALLRTTSATEFRENCARGVYRQSVDSESLILSEKPSNPATNGKAKTKASKCSSGYNHPSNLISIIGESLHVLIDVMLGTLFDLISYYHIAFICHHLTPISLNRLSAKHFPFPNLPEQAESGTRHKP